MADIVESLNRVGRALADPTRCRILVCLLQGPHYPTELAEHYLVDVLRYRVGRLELEAVARFGRLAHTHGLVANDRSLRLYGEADQP